MNVEVITETATLRHAIDAIERGRKTIAVVIDAGGMILGTISDGDIRRALLSGLPVDSRALDIANRHPLTAPEGTPAEKAAALLAARGVEALPLVDGEGRFVCTVHISQLTNIQGAPSAGRGFWAAVIMAGGLGRRLMPYTKDTPKPMLQVGGMPLLERNVRALVGLGVERIYISVNYLGNIIEGHFGDGSAFKSKIKFLRENEPLGTGGALRLLDEKPQGPVLVMNGDLLTGLDIGKLLAFHLDHAAQMTVAAKEYVVEVPFGVLRVSGESITALAEKPTESYLCNAGIYVLAPGVFDTLPQEGAFNMTNLIEQAMQSNRKVVAFPLSELWKDVGTPQQLAEARRLVEPGEISDV